MLALFVLGSLCYMVIKVKVRSIDMWIIKNPRYPNVHEFLILQQCYVCLLNANFWSRFHPGGSFKDTCVTIKAICIFYKAEQIYKMPMLSLIWERIFKWRKKMVKRSKGRKAKEWATKTFLSALLQCTRGANRKACLLHRECHVAFIYLGQETKRQ